MRARHISRLLRKGDPSRLQKLQNSIENGDNLRPARYPVKQFVKTGAAAAMQKP